MAGGDGAGKKATFEGALAVGSQQKSERLIKAVFGHLQAHRKPLLPALFKHLRR